MYVLAYIVAALTVVGTLIILNTLPSAPNGQGMTPLEAYTLGAGVVSAISFLLAGRAVQLLEKIATSLSVSSTSPEPQSTAPMASDEIVENPDGTFSVAGRTYKSRETAEAFIRHFINPHQERGPN